MKNTRLKFLIGFLSGCLMTTALWCAIVGMCGLIIAGDQICQVGTVTVNENPIYWIGQSFHTDLGVYLGVSLTLGLFTGYIFSVGKGPK